MKPIRKSLVLALLGVGLTTSANAADLLEQPIESVPLVPVEVGSGWYLRGDVSYDFKSDLDVKHRSYYDGKAGSFDEGGKYNDIDLKDNADYSVGFGYQFTDYFRGDLTGRYWQTDIDIDGDRVSDTFCNAAFIAGSDCDSGGGSDVKAWEVMANAYLDLGTFAGFTPYVGGGVGATHVKYDDVSIGVDCTGAQFCSGSDFSAKFDGDSDWRFTYALMAGASYDLTQTLKLDLGYRYVNVDDGDILSGNVGDASFKLKDDGFDRHTIQAGLRYSLF